MAAGGNEWWLKEKVRAHISDCKHKADLEKLEMMGAGHSIVKAFQ